jgi:SAM-dependent methyltransferase
MKQFWDERYAEAEYAYGTAPNDFLESEHNAIPVGKVLCLAEGEGRNSVFLAKQGYTVFAVDQSSVGLAKTQRLSLESDVIVDITEADLEDYNIEPSSWDGIVSISAHLPPSVRKRLHRQVVDGLKPGGVFILEAYTEKHLDMEGVGGPPAEQREMFMSLDELKQELEGLEFVIARETERLFDEGRYHQGPSAVVQIVARKAGDQAGQ